MKTPAFILSCALILLGLLGCQQPTEQEKLVKAIKENPELVRQWEQELMEIDKKSQLQTMQYANLPSSIKKVIPLDNNTSYYQIDLNLDNKPEVITINYQQNAGQLSIYYIDKNGKLAMTQTQHLSYFPKVEPALSAFPGLLKWVAHPNRTTSHRLDIRYENTSKEYRVVHFTTEDKQVSEGKTTSYDLMANFITGQTAETCRIWVDNKPQVTTTTSKGVKFPRLEQVSDSFINGLSSKKSCK